MIIDSSTISGTSLVSRINGEVGILTIDGEVVADDIGLVTSYWAEDCYKMHILDLSMIAPSIPRIVADYVRHTKRFVKGELRVVVPIHALEHLEAHLEGEPICLYKNLEEAMLG